jgi:hypothetical protein
MLIFSAVLRWARSVGEYFCGFETRFTYPRVADEFAPFYSLLARACSPSGFPLSRLFRGEPL